MPQPDTEKLITKLLSITTELAAVLLREKEQARERRSKARRSSAREKIKQHQLSFQELAER